MNYHLLLNGQQAGPYTLGQLKSMWSTGSITSQTLYWTEGMAEWIPLGDQLEPTPPADSSGGLSPLMKALLIFALIFVAYGGVSQYLSSIKRKEIEARQDAQHIAQTQARAAEEAAAAKQIASHPGRATIERIAEQYPGIKGITPNLFGEMTSTPAIGIYLPFERIQALTPEQKTAIKEYLGLLAIDAARHPRRYMTIPANAPAFAEAERNVSRMNESSWLIGEGKVQDGKMLLVRSVYEGGK